MAITTTLVGKLGGSGLVPPIPFGYTEADTSSGTFPIITINPPVKGRYMFTVHVQTSALSTDSPSSSPQLSATGSNVTFHVPTTSSWPDRVVTVDRITNNRALYSGFATGSVTINISRRSSLSSYSASCAGTIYITPLE